MISGGLTWTQNTCFLLELVHFTVQPSYLQLRSIPFPILPLPPIVKCPLDHQNRVTGGSDLNLPL